MGFENTSNSNSGLVTAIVRFKFFFLVDVDPTWDAIPLQIVTMAEPALYIIAACLVALRPLLNGTMDKVVTQDEMCRTGRSDHKGSMTEDYVMQKRSFQVSGSVAITSDDGSQFAEHRY